MAENYLITGYWGEPHVTTENDRGINAGTFGAGRFVLNVGRKFQAEYIGNNTIRLYDGKLLNNGAAAGIPAGEYIDLPIANAGQGMARNDLIVFQYSQDSSTLVENGSFVVLQGVETNGTPEDPELVQGDLLSGSATLDQMPLWRITVYGTAISGPVKVYTLATNIGQHTHKSLASLVTLNSKFEFYEDETMLQHGGIISKSGNVVNMSFILSPTASIAGSQEEVTLFTLPDEYCPATMQTAVCNGSGRALWLCRVYADGIVTFARYRTSWESYSAAAAGAWLPCSMTWIAGS